MLIVNFKSKVPLFLQENLARIVTSREDDIYFALSYPARLKNAILQDFGLSCRAPGQISPLHAMELGVRYAMVGHLERRVHLGESIELVKRKLAVALEYNVVPIVCVGLGDVHEVVREIDYLLGDLGEGHRIVVAYEHYESTDSGSVKLTQGEIRGVISIVRNKLDRISHGTRSDLSLIYGGSVTPELIGQLGGAALNGFLVGDRYLDVTALYSIVDAYKGFVGMPLFDTNKMVA